jgi:GNAT superfamily N-acetyltransferase
MLKFQIRLGQPSDIPYLVQYNLQMAWETEGKKLDPQIVQRGVSRVFEQPSLGFYLVAADEGEKLIGQLMVTTEWSDWRDGLFWWIQSVYVPEEARRQGVFRALFEEIQRMARQNGHVVGLRLYVEHENYRAQQTYSKLGMRRTSYEVMEIDWSNSSM